MRRPPFSHINLIYGLRFVAGVVGLSALQGKGRFGPRHPGALRGMSGGEEGQTPLGLGPHHPPAKGNQRNVYFGSSSSKNRAKFDLLCLYLTLIIV